MWSRVELSNREDDVLRRVACGLTYREIASEMNLGYETIATHMKSIRRKLGVRTRTEMAVWAVRNQKV